MGRISGRTTSARVVPMRAVARAAMAQIAVLPAAPEQQRRKLVERKRVDFTLELDDGFQRHPVSVPAPGVEFRRIAGAQGHVAVMTDHAQQEPDLLLAFVMAAQL